MILPMEAELVEISVAPDIKACAHCGCRIASGGHREKFKGRMLPFCCRMCAASYGKK